jgi:hypothetical protein
LNGSWGSPTLASNCKKKRAHESAKANAVVTENALKHKAESARARFDCMEQNLVIFTDGDFAFSAWEWCKANSPNENIVPAILRFFEQTSPKYILNLCKKQLLELAKAEADKAEREHTEFLAANHDLLLEAAREAEVEAKAIADKQEREAEAKRQQAEHASSEQGIEEARQAEQEKLNTVHLLQRAAQQRSIAAMGTKLGSVGELA